MPKRLSEYKISLPLIKLIIVVPKTKVYQDFVLYPWKTSFVKNSFKKWPTEIAFARIGQYRDNGFSIKLPTSCKPQSDCDRRTATDTRKNSFLAGESPCMFDRLFAGDLFHAIDDRQIQSVWNESSANPLDFVGPGLELLPRKTLCDDRAFNWLDSNADNLLFLFSLNVSRYTCNGPTCAHS